MPVVTFLVSDTSRKPHVAGQRFKEGRDKEMRSQMKFVQRSMGRVKETFMDIKTQQKVRA